MGKCNNFNFSEETDPCTNVKIGFNFSQSAEYQNNNTPIDITSDTFQMVIKDSLGGTILLTLNEVGDTMTTGLYIPMPALGLIFIQIMAADSLLVGEGIFPYEMTRTDPDGLLHIFMQGTIEFTNRGF